MKTNRNLIFQNTGWNVICKMQFLGAANQHFGKIIWQLRVTGIWEVTSRLLSRKKKEKSRDSLCYVNILVYTLAPCAWYYMTRWKEALFFFTQRSLLCVREKKQKVCMCDVCCLVRITVSLCTSLLTASVYVVLPPGRFTFLHMSPAADKHTFMFFPTGKLMIRHQGRWFSLSM